MVGFNNSLNLIFCRCFIFIKIYLVIEKNWYKILWYYKILLYLNIIKGLKFKFLVDEGIFKNIYFRC